MTPTCAEAIAGFSLSLDPGRLPERLRTKARHHFVDTLGSGIAATAYSPFAHSVRDGLLALYGEGEGPILGGGTLPISAAACANGTYCHALEFDDTHTAAIVNVGAFVVPAALAVGLHVGAPEAELLAAILAGGETAARLARAAVSVWSESGFHPASVCGVFGATVAASRLLGLDRAATVNALGLAGSFASGLYEPLAAGTPSKAMHAGWAANAAISATTWAAQGAAGPATVFEGEFGVFKAFFGLPPERAVGVVEGLGSDWLFADVALRPYPVCYMSQSPIEAAHRALGGARLDPAEVAEVRVSIPSPGVPVVLEPAEFRRRPRNAYDAKFGLPFCLAAMIVQGQVDNETFVESNLVDGGVLAVAERVRHVPRDYPEFPVSYPSAIEIETRDGNVHAAVVDSPPGSPQHPMDAKQVRRKLASNLRGTYLEPRTGRLGSLLEGLDSVGGLEGLGRLLASG